MFAEDGGIQHPLERGEAEELLTEIYDHELPPVLMDLVGEYQALDIARPPFVWKWVHRLAPQNTLPCVGDEYRQAVPIDKTIAILFVTILDDTLEQRRDRATFEELATIPFDYRRTRPGRSGVDGSVVTFAERVWDLLDDRLQRGPRYDTYADLFRFDVRQAITAIEYTDLAIDSPGLATVGDLERYESHNMVMFAYADVDMMHSPAAVDADLGTIRDAVWIAQQMARIGNWVSTWEREFREGDYSSGPVVYAIENGVVSLSELRAARAGEDRVTLEALIERIREEGVEELFLSRWADHHERLRAIDRDLETLDLESFVEGTVEVLRYHLASTGLK